MGRDDASRRRSIFASKRLHRLAFLCAVSLGAPREAAASSPGIPSCSRSTRPRARWATPPKRTLLSRPLDHPWGRPQPRGDGLVLTCNGTDDLTLAPSATSFAFATPVAEGRPYTVEVRAAPSGPLQSCVVGNATGIVRAGDVSHVTVDCATEGYTLRAHVADVVGRLSLANGTDVVSVHESGTVTFTRSVPTGQSYDLRIVSQPPTQRCLVRRGSGTMGTEDVLVLVRCFDDFVEHFDDGTELPPGWGISVLAHAGDPPWLLATEGASSAPNCLRVAGVTRTLDTVVTSPPIALVTDTPQLVFRHAYEATGFDGAALELKIDDGPFVDILEAAGESAFVSFGYTTLLSSLLTNPPLDDRRVWSGSSGGYVTSIVDLPADAQGKTVQLRWRWGNDGVGAAPNSGWRIDDVVVHR